jgi:hypothetical protein
MELEPRPEQPPAVPVTDDQRRAAADRLVDAAGTARLTLSEFSERVGAVWAAETAEQLTAATAGIELPLDLRSVICSEPEVELRIATLMGDVAVVVPDGVEVEVTGFDVMGDREVMLAPVPRVPGTPLIRVRAYAVMGDVLVYSDSTVPQRKGWRWLGMGHSDPHQKEISA